MLQAAGTSNGIQEASPSLAHCETWIPHKQVVKSGEKVATLTSVCNKLKTKMAEFISAQRLSEEEIKEESQPVVISQAAVPQPVVRIKAARLPKFTG